MRAALIYPHQLYDNHPAVASAEVCVLVEEPLFFTLYRFHAKKLILHRASMKLYATRLRDEGHEVRYVECHELADTGAIAELLRSMGMSDVQIVDPSDDWLKTRLTAALIAARIPYRLLVDPHFLTSEAVFANYAQGRKKLFFADFYAFQRKRLGILVGNDGKPFGGKWSFDGDNRKKLPRGVQGPSLKWPAPLAAIDEAQVYVDARFPDAAGDGDNFHFPINHVQAEQWLTDFLDERLTDFGQYEDAISDSDAFLFHSVLTPMLNIGLLSPLQVLNAAPSGPGKCR